MQRDGLYSTLVLDLHVDSGGRRVLKLQRCFTAERGWEGAAWDRWDDTLQQKPWNLIGWRVL